MTLYHRSVVIAYIEGGCRRFGFQFKKPMRELRLIYQSAPFDELARLVFLALREPWKGDLEGKALTEIELKNEFVEACKALGLE